MPTPAEAERDTAGLLSAASHEGTIKAYYPFWDAQYRPYLIDAVRALPPVHFDYKPRPEMLTAQQIVVHIAEAELWWVRTILDGEPVLPDDVVPHDDPAQGWVTVYDAPDHMALLMRLEEAHRHTQRWFGLPASELAKTRTRKRADGSEVVRTVHWILDHVQEHEVHHRAQLNLYLRMLGLVPPSI